MKATDLLEQQHREIGELFSEIAQGNTRLLADLADALAAHMKIEQELFYPALRAFAREEVLASFEEHSLAELALKRLLALDPEGALFDARLSLLRDLIEMHVEEEQGELFSLARKWLSPETELALGTEMEFCFEEALRRGHESLLPEGSELTSADIAGALIEAEEIALLSEDAGDERRGEIARPGDYRP